MRSPQEAQQHAPLDEEREREAIEAGRMELHRLFHEEHGNDARELIRDNDGQYINEKTRDVWEWCEKIIMASLAHARKQQEGRDHLRGATEMMEPQGCRERFEAWWSRTHSRLGATTNKAEWAWEAWQACESQKREERGCDLCDGSGFVVREIRGETKDGRPVIAVEIPCPNCGGRVEEAE